MFRDLLVDLRDAVRSLRGSASLTASAVATLAIGIGMTTAIYTFVNGVVLRPLPFPDENRLVTLCERYPGVAPDWCGISPPNVEDIAAASRSIESIGIGREWGFHLDTPNGAESIDGGLASPGLFTAVGARAQLGRLIQPGDLIGRQSTVAVLTHEMWQTRFGGRGDVVGEVISLDGDPVTIVGVLEPGFVLPRIGEVALWRPLHIDPRDERHREWRGFVSFAKLREGVSLASARGELATLSARLRTDHFAPIDGWGITLVGTRDLVIGNARSLLYLFLGSVSLVLLIGCANVANLLLARSTARARELALRAALGAAPSRLVRATLVESFVLALAGATAGVALAAGLTRAFKAAAPAGIPRVSDVVIDWRVLVFALLLAIGTTVLFGLLPALRASRADLSQAIREGGRGSTGSHGTLRAALVVGELALAVTLVTSAGLLARSFQTLARWQPGFERDHVLTFSLFAPTAKYSRRESVASLMMDVERALGAIPGVTAVGSASAGPLFGGRETWEMVIGDAPNAPRASIRWLDASPSYFATLGIPIVRGRALAETDVGTDALVGVVNETLARRFWPSGDPIGKKLVFGLGTDRAVFTIVGVSRDVPPLNPGDAIDPQLVWSNRQLPRPFSYFILRTAVAPATLSSAIRARVRSIDRDLEARNLTTLPERMSRELKAPRFTMLLVTAFGLAALVFAAIGTYGLVSYVTAQRTREIGIRLALGALPAQIAANIIGSGLALAGTGVLLGIAASIATAGLIRAQLVGISPSDPLTILASALVLLGVAALACAVPAWRASKVDPASTLTAD